MSTSTSARTGAAQGRFDHRMAVFGSDDGFVATALPFLAEGLAAAGEPPPVAIAAPGLLAALRDGLGADAKEVGFIDHADWYTGTAANAVAQGAGYLAAHTGPGGRVHLLMEPDWAGRAGRSARESVEWIRYECLANLLFAPFATTALCAYDTRTAGPAVVDAARRAHPGTGVYEQPPVLVRELDAVPLSPPPRAVTRLAAAESVRAWSAEQGLAAADAELFARAVVAAAAAHGPVVDFVAWGEAPSCVCELRLCRAVADPLAGFVPPRGGEPGPGQGLWFTRQVCAYVDVRDGVAGDGARIRVQYA
ncbi:MEDS domain-containing protein [Streptomyces sp. NPDC059224]|uniref:MEDS domain-containing protein n=1 Tax=Streptomyces sp. NPDC059224 TaxID=3346775 RepID=UPI0036AAFCD6